MWKNKKTNKKQSLIDSKGTKEYEGMKCVFNMCVFFGGMTLSACSQDLYSKVGGIAIAVAGFGLAVKSAIACVRSPK